MVSKKQRQNFAKNKEMITCECGAVIRKDGRAEHYRSKKHNDYIINKNSHAEEDIALQNNGLCQPIEIPITNEL